MHILQKYVNLLKPSQRRKVLYRDNFTCVKKPVEIIEVGNSTGDIIHKER
jgi:hypothetical protein